MITLGGSLDEGADGQPQVFTGAVTGSGGQADISVRKNGEVIDTSANASGSFAFDDLGLGNYQFRSQ